MSVTFPSIPTIIYIYPYYINQGKNIYISNRYDEKWNWEGTYVRRLDRQSKKWNIKREGGMGFVHVWGCLWKREVGLIEVKGTLHRKEETRLLVLCWQYVLHLLFFNCTSDLISLSPYLLSPSLLFMYFLHTHTTFYVLQIEFYYMYFLFSFSISLLFHDMMDTDKLYFFM